MAIRRIVFDISLLPDLTQDLLPLYLIIIVVLICAKRIHFLTFCVTFVIFGADVVCFAALSLIFLRTCKIRNRYPEPVFFVKNIGYGSGSGSQETT